MTDKIKQYKSKCERKFHVGADEEVAEESALVIRKIATVGSETVWEVEDEQGVRRASYPSVMTLEQVLPGLCKDRSIVKMDWEYENTDEDTVFIRGKRIRTKKDSKEFLRVNSSIDTARTTPGIEIGAVLPANMPESAQAMNLNIGLVTGGPKDVLATIVYKIHPNIIPDGFEKGYFSVCPVIIRGSVKITAPGGFEMVKGVGEATFTEVTKEDVEGWISDGTWNTDPGYWGLKYEAASDEQWAFLCFDIGEQPWKYQSIKLKQGEKNTFPSRKKNQWACLAEGVAKADDEDMPIWKLWYIEEDDETEFTAVTDCHILTWTRRD